ncbi:MAG: hypothetical protein EA361_09080 [Bacteroidetes bacterium]|nr:MAG: hypothetical protein EA361_09080 [Bacteroidota bacterium]
MKLKTSTLFLVLIAIMAFNTTAQPPQAFNYQAVLRDDAGQVMASEQVAIQIEILRESAAGEVVFSETHSTQTNELGLVNLAIGSIEGLENIQWGNESFFIRVSIDGNEMGTTQLLSVPFALYAQGSADAFSGDYNDLDNTPDLEAFIAVEDPQSGDILYFADQSWHTLATGQEGQVLMVVNGMPQWADLSADDDGTVTDIDGNVYTTIEIGDQIWMAENLRTTRYADGTIISGAYAYDNSDENADNYGKLYTWEAVMGGSTSSDENPSGVQGVCPAGWHVPSDAEWTQLTDYITGGLATGGIQLRSCRQINSPLGGECDTEEHPRWDEHPVHYGTDEYGFGALPGGYRPVSGDFFQMSWDAYFWSSTQEEGADDRAWRRFIYYDFPQLQRGLIWKTSAFSVRCVKNN